ncbi:hypothetical protein OHC33_004195 [Knufia fluminis]|uniref:Carboxylic ester hydrolase n=1 Tax=Knufia fluminis TaxID=191047 RepID=A0AAN8EM68_9EURO|nr:hypothetical protein OHC33_004195 [Knufia fluminis]
MLIIGPSSDCPLTASPPTDYPGFVPQAQRVIQNFASGAGTPQNEDCLTLNVWTKPSTSKTAKDVLVFFYGGRFTIGNTNSPFYNGQYLANAQDVVVVTLNYRLNIFGFPGAPDLSEQNLGLRDQRLAVEWVRDDIAAFGGDPSKITIFGQSSGGVAVDWWSYAYQEDPIVHGHISHSGNAFSFPLNLPNVTLKNWYNVTAQLGCGSTGETLECMRQADWVAIKNATAKVRPSLGGSPLRSIPALYPVADNVTVFTDYLDRAQRGDFSKLPYLLGNNDYEQGYYKIPAYAAGTKATEAQGDQFLLESFTCPNAFEAQNRKEHGVPVWLFRYFCDLDNTWLYPDSEFSPGGSQAYHGSDLQMIFGASEDVSGLPTTEEQREVTGLMQKAWAAFAEDPAKGLESVMGWPKFDEEKESLILLARDNSVEAEIVLPSEYDAECDGVVLAGLPD